MMPILGPFASKVITSINNLEYPACLGSNWSSNCDRITIPRWFWLARFPTTLWLQGIYCNNIFRMPLPKSHRTEVEPIDCKKCGRMHCPEPMTTEPLTSQYGNCLRNLFVYFQSVLTWFDYFAFLLVWFSVYAFAIQSL